MDGLTWLFLLALLVLLGVKAWLGYREAVMRQRTTLALSEQETERTRLLMASGRHQQ